MRDVLIEFTQLLQIIPTLSATEDTTVMNKHAHW